MNMKKILLILAAAFAATPLLAEKNSKMEPWQDPNVFEENRLPMAATFVTDQQKTLTLNGVWKFKWNETIEGRTKGFEAVDYNDADWGTIPVPGMWELNGYNDPLYLNVGYAWRGHYTNNPPYPPTEHNYVGQYRRTFNVDKSWLGKQICLCIGSATSNVRVWVNGKMVGYSEDSKLEARFDLTKYVKAGENLIALEIFRWCDGSYLEDQDFWRLSGIARGVYVSARKSVLGSPVIFDDKVYVGASDGCFRALGLKTGKAVWTYSDVQGFIECRAYVDKEQVVFGSWGNRLYSLDPQTGALQWEWKCEKPSRMYSPAAVWPVKACGKIFIAVPDRRLYALDAATGKELRHYEKSAREAVGVSPDGKKVYCKSMWHTITSVDATSLEVDWRAETGAGYEISPTSIVRIGDEVIMPTDKGNIIGFDARDGRRLWARKISIALVNPMEVWSEGTDTYILASTMDGTVTLLRNNS